MNTVYEAITTDGKHKLVSPSEINGLVKTARLYCKTERGVLRKFRQMIANMMYCRGYIILTKISYSLDTPQSRAIICAKSI